MRDERKPRGSLLLMLAAFCLLMLVWVIFLRQISDRHIGETVPSDDTGILTTWTWTKSKTATGLLTNTPPPVVSAAVAESSRESDIAEPNKNLDTPLGLDLALGQDAIVPAIAVVDLDRVISSHGPAEDSQAAREKVMQEIKAAVAARAAAHGYVLVINSSAKTPNRTPLILNEGRPDITAEVMRELSRSNVLTTSQ